ncbi:unnamed protein product, partial [Mesorhabditis spiculigera]
MTSEEVSAHYNAVPQQKIEDRENSRIFYMRNMNNWLKAQLITDISQRLKRARTPRPRVLDIACGKGGDLRKWQNAFVSSAVFADVADVSIEQAKGRYDEGQERARGQGKFPAQFIVADCTKELLAEKYDDPTPFDLVSCQFALHYSFISEQGARTFLTNCTERLRPGGYFIGTLPDANRIVWAARQGNGEFKNSVCSIKYSNPKEILNGATPPLFGAEFHFTLDEQVNCPEFLCHFPLLVQMLEELDMELVMHMPFPDAINHYKNAPDGLQMMDRMRALELYPKDKPSGGPDDYEKAAAYQKMFECFKLGTLSLPEWEAVSMYLVFVFKKKGSPEPPKEAANGHSEQASQPDADGDGAEVEASSEVELDDPVATKRAKHE